MEIGADQFDQSVDTLLLSTRDPGKMDSVAQVETRDLGRLLPGI